MKGKGGLVELVTLWMYMTKRDRACIIGYMRVRKENRFAPAIEPPKEPVCEQEELLKAIEPAMRRNVQRRRQEEARRSKRTTLLRIVHNAM